MSNIELTQCAGCKRKYPLVYGRCPYCKTKNPAKSAGKPPRDSMRGKLASDERIDQNIKRLVEFDRTYQSLVATRDSAGLQALAEQAEQANQFSLAHKALSTAKEFT